MGVKAPGQEQANVGGWEAGGSTPEGSEQPATEGSQDPGLAEPDWGQTVASERGFPGRKECLERDVGRRSGIVGSTVAPLPTGDSGCGLWHP